MGIEIPAEYGGAEASFTTAIIAIEELAKVDPSISVMADVHVPFPSLHIQFQFSELTIRTPWSILHSDNTELSS